MCPPHPPTPRQRPSWLPHSPDIRCYSPQVARGIRLHHHETGTLALEHLSPVHPVPIWSPHSGYCSCHVHPSHLSQRGRLATPFYCSSTVDTARCCPPRLTPPQSQPVTHSFHSATVQMGERSCLQHGAFHDGPARASVLQHACPACALSK
jgi:hypothetical protein